MTVQFKSATVPVDVEVAYTEDIETAYKKFFISSKEKPKKYPVYPKVFFASYYLPHGNKKDDWQNYDMHQPGESNSNALYLDLKSYLEQRRVSESWDGFKIVGVSIDFLNGTMTLLPDYCMEYIKPIEKVYINGPKKTKDPFLAKKGGQYAKAI